MLLALFPIVADLYDFSKSKTKSEKNSIKKVSAFARKSSNGKLVEVNKKSIAIFRFGSEVFAIDEKCPHVGKLFEFA